MFSKLWLKLPIGDKVHYYSVAVVVTVILAALLSIMTINFAMGGFGVILQENKQCQEFMSAFNSESEYFRSYVKNQTETNHSQYLAAVEKTKTTMDALPDNYSDVGRDRFGLTWNIRHAYESYSTTRDEIVARLPHDPDGFVNRLYSVYDMQQYIEGYARRLLQMTVEDGTASYNSKLPFFSKLPFAMGNAVLILALIAFLSGRLFTKTIVDPVVSLSKEAKRISDNDFSSEDLLVSNEDEIGELVRTFNNMKHSTENYINTLVENHRMNDLLQKEQMENIEIEKRLDQNRLELLKSQINPHFLFNTLNMIASMADIEDADTTAQMIHSLSALFRYNLSTKQQIVPLSQEIEIADNYMYLQKMRFGTRIRYKKEIQEGMEEVYIPSFTLQPLLENAVIHGVSKQEQGGEILLKITKEYEQNVIRIIDDGKGIPIEQLRKLRAMIRIRRTATMGIGLGNICQRVLKLYKNSSFDIVSEEGKGTTVVIMLPESEHPETENMI